MIDAPVGSGCLISYRVFDTPVTTVVKGGKHRTEYAIGEMHKLLVRAVMEPKFSGDVLVVIEQVSASFAKGKKRREGATSSLRSGMGIGIWFALLTVARIPWRVVAPATWKKAQGLIGTDKKYSRLIAQQRFPLADLGRVKDHGRAEALLLADYARQQNW